MADDWTEEERAVTAAATAALQAMQAPSNLVTRSGSLLRLVRLGMEDMAGSDEYRVLLGFYAVVVLGRSMIATMGKLANYDQSAYAAWYAP
jgi:hypothetical protein